MTAGLTRLARVAFTFVMMNVSAVAGLFSLGRGRRVWKRFAICRRKPPMVRGFC